MKTTWNMRQISASRVCYLRVFPGQPNSHYGHACLHSTNEDRLAEGKNQRGPKSYLLFLPSAAHAGYRCDIRRRRTSPTVLIAASAIRCCTL
jgi:hypothetical protein